MIQNLILEGHTTDAIEKTKELFPNLLNNKNLVFILKVRQFIEMINGTESEVPKLCTSSTTNALLSNSKTCLNGSSFSVPKSNTSSYTSEHNQTTNSIVQQHSNGIIETSSSANNNNESSEGILLYSIL